METQREITNRTLVQEMDAVARASGFPDYAAMQRQLLDEDEAFRLEPNARKLLAERLQPIAEKADKAAKSAGPAADITGLPSIADLQKSVARLIRVLLLGHTDEEIEYLNAQRESMARADRFPDNAAIAIARLEEMSDLGPKNKPAARI
jgi:hypothetical protein